MKRKSLEDFFSIFGERKLTEEEKKEYYMLKAEYYFNKRRDASGKEYLKFRRKELKSEEEWIEYVR